jgi:hypothetical protein
MFIASQFVPENQEAQPGEESMSAA